MPRPKARQEVHADRIHAEVSKEYKLSAFALSKMNSRLLKRVQVLLMGEFMNVFSVEFSPGQKNKIRIEFAEESVHYFNETDILTIKFVTVCDHA